MLVVGRVDHLLDAVMVLIDSERQYGGAVTYEVLAGFVMVLLKVRTFPECMDYVHYNLGDSWSAFF